ncbi:hypothetical protein [Solimicrobium silvestre]|uniref:Uncharacterized protein n=1 Tax=Solimicrobium silvestre TaxID=2099400 RepID=A0A2S9GZA6_9BURK|nr:hypothetical protein [Solimicrobium silvestre]PRC93065.1 hypothetical protein S2091_2151 [Solimicrobium silvestre]
MAKRAQPDRAALEIAHRQLCTDTPLDDMLASAALRPIVENVARRHMVRRAKFDVKKLQANDFD